MTFFAQHELEGKYLLPMLERITSQKLSVVVLQGQDNFSAPRTTYYNSYHDKSRACTNETYTVVGWSKLLGPPVTPWKQSDLLFPFTCCSRKGSSLHHLLTTLVTVVVRSIAQLMLWMPLQQNLADSKRTDAENSLSGVRKLMCNRTCLHDIFVQKSSISAWYRLASGCSPESVCVSNRVTCYLKKDNDELIVTCSIRVQLLRGWVFLADPAKYRPIDLIEALYSLTERNLNMQIWISVKGIYWLPLTFHI